MKKAKRPARPRKPKLITVGCSELWIEDLGPVFHGGYRRSYFNLSEAKKAHAWLGKYIAWSEARDRRGK